MKSLLYSFDTKLTDYIQSWPRQVEPIMWAATLIGRPVFVLGSMLLLVLLGIYNNNMEFVVAGIYMMAVFGLGSWLKLVLKRKRPVTEYVAMKHLKTFSFPSGHALGAASSFGLLAYLATWLPFPLGFIAGSSITVVIVIIGISRVYLGAHFPSDVVGGWLLGGISLLVLPWVISAILPS